MSVQYLPTARTKDGGLSDWLADRGLAGFASLFEREQIDLEALPHLTDDDLRSLGLPLGPRRKLLHAAANLAGTTDKDAVAAPTPAPGDAAEAERRQLSVMFSDLAGWTAMSGAMDPEDARDVLLRYQGVCASAIARYDGMLAKFMGDGVLAYFGYPRTREDEAERAVRAALDLTHAVGELAAPDGRRLTARAGVATGLVVVGDLIGRGASQEQTVIGDAPNLAARLQNEAAPGQVVIAAATRRLLGAGFDLVDLGRRRLKGIEEPVEVTAVAGERRVENRFEAKRDRYGPLFGREAEVEALCGLWDEARAGRGQVAVLLGEAGIGKSRIAHALMDATAHDAHTRIRYQCSPFHRDSALWPVIRQLQHVAKLVKARPGASDLDRIEAVAEKSGLEPAKAAPILASLIGLDVRGRYGDLDLTPQALRLRTLEVLIEQIVSTAERQPVLAILEDAHWIDPTTLELLTEAARRVADARILLVVTSRPERAPRLPEASHITRLRLERLEPEKAEAIICSLGGDRLPEETVAAIVARTGGVPLFVEEMTKAVLATGETAVPATLQDSLMARLDQIPEVKEIAQTAAAIGREFKVSLLAGVMGQSEAEVLAKLEKLAAVGVVVRYGGARRVKYAFKHALVQDCAYDSLLKRRRREMHREITRVICDRFPGMAAAEPEVLAHHHTRASQFAAAIPLWRKAGELALSRMALVEAIAHVNQGLDILERLPHSRSRDELELDLRRQLATTWMAYRGWTDPEVQANLHAALDLAKSLDREEAMLPLYYGLWAGKLTQGRFADAQDWVCEFLDRAASSGDAHFKIVGHTAACSTSYWRGEFEESHSHGQRALTLYDETRQPKLAGVWNVDPKTDLGLYTCLGLWIRGYPDQAVTAAAAMDAHVRKRGHPFDIGFALTIGGLLWDFLREPARILERAEEAEEIGRSNSLPFLSDVLAQLFKGIAWIRMGRLEDGAGRLRRATDRWTEGGAGGLTPYLRAVLAEGVARAGDLEGGLDLIELALSQIRRPQWEERAHLAEVLRIKAWMLEEKGAFGAARSNLCEALAVARQQNAKSWELRVATSLARLNATMGEPRDDHRLKHACDWFGEGFETADLKAAREQLL